MIIFAYNICFLSGDELKITEYNKKYNTPAEQPSDIPGKKTKAAQMVFDWITSVVIAVVFLCVVFTFFVRPVKVDGDSMLPTLQDKNWLLVSAFDSNPEQGEIVIVTQPNETTKGGPVVKRVIAVGGQEVDIDFEQEVLDTYQQRQLSFRRSSKTDRACKKLFQKFFL